ncbi:hypothetical protein [Mangrovibrevibacter kandeliae]|uniref:hypothetical protein n=1 Tax=Mangrovibrevibacter kandeliae TaxID=2968473 RepID=UPI0021182518|nr:hypothetical protein [Aurantimonas sp. CSK15Z-1]MCQ8783343.1 hypothetical protein [Aurantimonas sp. CSK15Z-1]
MAGQRQAEVEISARAARHGLAALRVRITAVRLGLALWRVGAVKANFDPNQPRHPKGSGDVSGRWREAVLEVDIPGPEDGAPKTPPKQRRLNLPRPGPGHNGGPPLDEPPPEIPTERPIREKLRIAVVRGMIRFATKAILRGAAGPLGAALTTAEAVHWLYHYYPLIESYFDPPKTLAELQEAAAQGKAEGHDIHHIAEKAPAEADGSPMSMMEGPENLARIPRAKHWELNSWYETPSDAYGGMSPRRYLLGKSWDERTKIGLIGLLDMGILKP